MLRSRFHSVAAPLYAAVFVALLGGNLLWSLPKFVQDQRDEVEHRNRPLALVQGARLRDALVFVTMDELVLRAELGRLL